MFPHMAKGTSCGIELSTFMERYLGLSVWVQCNYKGPFGREEGETEKEM